MATIQGVYLALFGRPADPEGLAYFNSVTQSGQNLTPIFGTLATTDEYKSRFDGLENDQIVNSIFRSLFNRNADSEGASFFAAELASGRQTIETIAINILDGAQGEDRATVANKLAASSDFTTALNSPGEVTAYVGSFAEIAGRDFLRLVGASDSTIPSDQDVADAVQNIEIGFRGDDTVVSIRNGPELQGTTINDLRAVILHIFPGDSGFTDTNRDNITGFKSGIDVVNFDGPAGTAANYTLLEEAFSTPEAARVGADEALDEGLRYAMTSVGDDKFIFVDSDGDGAADISARFVGLQEFSMYDIV